MENKYYQPEIDEFHVGFEFEFLNSIEWEKHNFMCLSEFTFDDMPELAKESRVKYLDEIDILDLGFEEVGSKWSKVLGNTANLYVSEEDNLMLAHYPSINKITIATRDYSKNNITIKGTWDDKQINLITVKNKSELKKVLKQIEL